MKHGTDKPKKIDTNVEIKEKIRETMEEWE